MTHLFGTLLKIAIAALIFYLALMMGHSNANASIMPGTEQPQLEAKLPTAVKVYCATTDIPGAMGWTWLTAPEIYLSHDTCADLANGNYAEAYLALYHEWWHQAFHETNEVATNTGAITMYRYLLRHYWGFTALKAQTFYNALWVVGFAPGYHPSTAQNTADPLIVDGF